jgi:hypothetical protein
MCALNVPPPPPQRRSETTTTYNIVIGDAKGVVIGPGMMSALSHCDYCNVWGEGVTCRQCGAPYQVARDDPSRPRSKP